MLKTDIATQPERPSAASAIRRRGLPRGRLNTSCEQVIFFDRRVLTLSPGLVITGNTGSPGLSTNRRSTGANTERPGGEISIACRRARWLPGYLLGPFRYERNPGRRPNDVIPHEDRRELRGARLVAAWLNHSMPASRTRWTCGWQEPQGRRLVSRIIRHYYLDTSDVFGSEWDWTRISRRLGKSYVLRLGDIGADFVTSGYPGDPGSAPVDPGFEQFGYFSAENFDPEGWKNEYPNPRSAGHRA